MAGAANRYSKEFTSSVGDALNTAADKVAETANSVSDAAQKMASSILSTPTSGFQSGVKLLFFLAGLALFLFLFLIGIHYTVTPVFSFFPGDAGVIPIAAAGEKIICSPAAFLPYTQKCEYKATKLVAFNVAFAFDLFVNSDFTTTVPRVVLYKSAQTTPVTMMATDTEAGLSAKFPASNFVIFVDALKNDLKLMLQTKADTAATATQEIHTVIENLPLRTPVRIGLVVFTKHIEVYQDGNLVATVAAPTNLLRDETSEMYLYGPPQFVSGSVKVARITYWPYVISPKMFRVDAADKANPAWFSS